MTFDATASYCRYVVFAVALAGVVLLITAGLAWTARLVHVGNLDAQDLADKVAMSAPVSALDWPELHLNAGLVRPGRD
jgi:ligand-binding SRPBCC domain-containing protein